uniref:C-type lectin domain-containing protein n=1 Tax=Neogobius melanostomus TaxID=47308 RepID=A0A8C6SM40_9GOBI
MLNVPNKTHFDSKDVTIPLVGKHYYKRLFEYHYIEKQMTWTDARQYCREHYTDLATLENAEDVHRLKIPYGAWAWIGLFDGPASWKGVMTSDSNSWRWSATGTTSPGGFQNWASGDPDNYNAIEHCVFIKNGLWGDHDCARLFSFFCYTGKIFTSSALIQNMFINL